MGAAASNVCAAARHMVRQSLWAWCGSHSGHVAVTVGVRSWCCRLCAQRVSRQSLMEGPRGLPACVGLPVCVCVCVCVCV